MGDLSHAWADGSFRRTVLGWVLPALVLLTWNIASIRPAWALACQSNGNGGGNWNATATWTGCRAGGPNNTDSATINDGDTVTLTAAASAASVTITTLNGNGNAILAVGAQTLTIVGGLTLVGDAGGNATLSVITISTGTVNVGGTVSVLGPTKTANQITFSSTGTMNI